jgi:hypothetical protein
MHSPLPRSRRAHERVILLPSDRMAYGERATASEPDRNTIVLTSHGAVRYVIPTQETRLSCLGYHNGIILKQGQYLGIDYTGQQPRKSLLQRRPQVTPSRAASCVLFAQSPSLSA